MHGGAFQQTMSPAMILDFFIGFFLTLLPARFRQRSLPNWRGNLSRSALASGVTQLILCLSLLILRYFSFFDRMMKQIDPSVFIAAAQKGGESAVRGFGLILLPAYILTPLSLVLIYFAFEGAVRMIAVTSTGEIVGTLPALLLEKAIETVNEHREEKRQGERVPDIVAVPPIEGSGYDLSVTSCRAKPNWDQFMTVSYNDALYEIADYLEAAPPRRHVYLLRRAPVHKVVRGLHHYDPEEVMKN